MPSINKINVTERTYLNHYNNISFKSKFVPNKALSDAFYAAEYQYPFNSTYWAKHFANIIEFLLNDGRDNLIEVTNNKKGGSALKINGKKVHYVRGNYPEFQNITEYWNIRDILYPKALTVKEFDVLKSAINKLNADLNADDVTKNPRILDNLEYNIKNIDKILDKYTKDLLHKLKAQIFNETK